MKKVPSKEEAAKEPVKDPVMEAETNPHPPGTMAYQLWEA